ncbi:hypothetical protein BDW42DRAFT_188104 [Aspergillus taichungensis]|uniref:Uncharacterized protein n=1 Tax=Aspergillus taichungensis TaxID=482145 RepID=A0A2J5HK98_9EURO|nr:hypothetical protein BDW42DRAFT_188104 [Aspergillus taichungensis]
MSQPFPNYYLTRPDQVQVPLIPLDELPHWIEVGAWNWSDTSLFETMDPVSCDCIPRSGDSTGASPSGIPPASELHAPQAPTPPPCVVRRLVSQRAPGSLALLSFPRAFCRLWHHSCFARL